MELEWLRITLMLGGVVFLVYMGYSIWRSQPAQVQTGTSIPAQKQILFALSVSLLNPHAILDTVGVIGTSALSYIGTEQMMFTIACITVSLVLVYRTYNCRRNDETFEPIREMDDYFQ